MANGTARQVQFGPRAWGSRTGPAAGTLVPTEVGVNQPTIADVARAAGVSVATVSRALRGLDKVHPETRERVLAAASELDYITSPTASGLASGRTRLVGVITPYMARWFFVEVISAIEKALRQQDHHVLVMDLERSEAPSSRHSLDQRTLFKRVDGVVAINVDMLDTEAELVRQLALPVVTVGSRFDTAPRIGIDDVGTATLAADHLLDLGHRRIAYIGKHFPGSAHTRTPSDRLAGFRASLGARSISVPDEWIFESEWRARDAFASALSLLRAEDRPTAILAASDEMAIGALAAARELGIRVPDDLSIVGIDDHELAEPFGLTTVRQNVVDQGVAAAEALLAQLGLADPALAVDRSFPVELVLRRSTAAPTDR